MTYKTNKTNSESIKEQVTLIPPHGGYKNLESYKLAVIICDANLVFCDKYMTYKTNKSYRTYDQMVQAARSGKQNIAEGSLASGTSKKTELKLLGVARASFGELLEDVEDYIRQHGLNMWGKDSEQAKNIRSLAYKSNKSYTTYKSYIESENPEVAANTILCLLNQENYLLDRQLRALEREFMEKGGFTERLYKSRKNYLSRNFS